MRGSAEQNIGRFHRLHCIIYQITAIMFSVVILHHFLILTYPIEKAPVHIT